MSDQKLHFVLRKFCMYCRRPPSGNPPIHVVLSGNIHNAIELRKSYMFCQKCPNMIYDYYKDNECELCVF